MHAITYVLIALRHFPVFGFYANDGSGACNGLVVTSTTNALNQSVSGTYDCNTGLLTNLTGGYDFGHVGSIMTTYDAMGRTLIVTKPDKINSVMTIYNGATTDSWDENDTHMQHTTDALGRFGEGDGTQYGSLSAKFAGKLHL